MGATRSARARLLEDAPGYGWKQNITLIGTPEADGSHALYKSAVLVLLSCGVAAFLLFVPAPKYQEPDSDATDVSDVLSETTPEELLSEYSRHFRLHDRGNVQKGRIACRQLFADVEDGRLKSGPAFERAWRSARQKLSRGRSELKGWGPPTPFAEAEADLQESFAVLDKSLDCLRLSVRATDTADKAKLWRQAQQKLGKGLALSREGERETTDLLGLSASPRI